MAKFFQSDIDRALSKVMHPEIKYSLVDIGTIKNVVCEEGRDNFTKMAKEGWKL